MHMDSEEFIIGVTGEDLGHLMIHFFDEIMVLYNLVGNRKDVHVSADSTSAATFCLTADDKDQALRIYNNLNNLTFRIYDINFLVSMDLESSGLIRTSIERL